MNALEYYKNIFGPELIRIQSSVLPSDSDRLSIVSLLPSDNYPGGLAEQVKAFDETPSKRLFLFCYFFTALIDQAIHSGLRAEHHYFNNIAKYPKIVGILAMYWHNLHPAVLLLSATLYIPKDEGEKATAEFNQLANFFPNDYCDFLEKEYPKITGRLQGYEERINACRVILNEISNSMAFLFVPQSLGPYSDLKPNIKLYKNWVLYFSGKINDKIKIYEQ